MAPTPKALALAYLDAFCRGDLDAVRALLADDLVFEGPLFKATSADAYLEALRLDPPEPCAFDPLSWVEGGDRAELVCRYSKAGHATEMTLGVTARGGRITTIRLAFDTARIPYGRQPGR